MKIYRVTMIRGGAADVALRQSKRLMSLITRGLGFESCWVLDYFRFFLASFSNIFSSVECPLKLTEGLSSLAVWNVGDSLYKIKQVLVRKTELVNSKKSVPRGLAKRILLHSESPPLCRQGQFHKNFRGIHGRRGSCNKVNHIFNLLSSL